jgi:hypothetical protein
VAVVVDDDVGVDLRQKLESRLGLDLLALMAVGAKEVVKDPSMVEKVRAKDSIRPNFILLLLPVCFFFIFQCFHFLFDDDSDDDSGSVILVWRDFSMDLSLTLRELIVIELTSRSSKKSFSITEISIGLVSGVLWCCCCWDFCGFGFFPRWLSNGPSSVFRRISLQMSCNVLVAAVGIAIVIVIAMIGGVQRWFGSGIFADPRQLILLSCNQVLVPLVSSTRKIHRTQMHTNLVHM